MNGEVILLKLAVGAKPRPKADAAEEESLQKIANAEAGGRMLARAQFTKIAVGLSKRATMVQEVGTPNAPNPHGTHGRLRILAAPRLKAKGLQGPRAHAPRLGPPGT